MNTHLFDQIPEDAETVIARVVRAAREECLEETCLVHPVLERCAADAVRGYWDSRIKAFVPLLALRQVRDCIRVGRCPDVSDAIQNTEVLK